MAYTSDIIVFKKESLENAKRAFSNYIFKDLYENIKEEGKWIYSPTWGIFYDFFGDEFENEEVRIIDEATYTRFYFWLEEKLKYTTLYDLIDNNNEHYVHSLMTTYKAMSDNPVDFKTEVVTFQHDW